MELRRPMPGHWQDVIDWKWAAGFAEGRERAPEGHVPLPYFSYFGDCFSEMGRNYWKATGKGVLMGIWDSEVHELPITLNYTSILRDSWVQGSMLGDVTLRKISSLGCFSLVGIENTHRKFPEEAEHVKHHGQGMKYSGREPSLKVWPTVT